MTARTKSILVILGSLLIGAAIGALATGAIINSRIEQFRALRMKGGMMRMVEQVVEPHDDAQRAKIRGVLDRFAEKQSKLRQLSIEQHEQLMDSLRSELGAILTPEQKQRLDDWMANDRGPELPPGGHHPDGDRGFGPPPFGEPPFGGPPPRRHWRDSTREMQQDTTKR